MTFLLVTDSTTSNVRHTNAIFKIVLPKSALPSRSFCEMIPFHSAVSQVTKECRSQLIL